MSRTVAAGQGDAGRRPSDPFEQLVTRIAADMRQLRAPAERIAEEAHYSRPHFERVVSAISGETPTAFCRRILMERAAYRMIHTDRHLLDIAQEAGFSSHEAFTRAFRRAYGSSPSSWRQRPSKFQLPSPNNVHFYPPAGLRLPPRDRSSQDAVVCQMVEHHVWVTTQLVERALRISDADLDAPLPNRVDGIDGNSLRWLLSRLIGQMDMWLAAMNDREYNFACENAESVASMQRRIASVGPQFVASVRSVAREGAFDETFVDAFFSPPMVVTYAAMVSHVLTFSAHHRLIALTTLKRLGMTDLGYGDPKTWFTSSWQPEARQRDQV
ncbi:MAG TPA: helix-turn-helix transcriptional regulator [Nocardioides sp.]|uniref:helix-turn-helix transcriptional regulator n=1 Tax=Nocardioides sp. TaxID=35761 RepID=UPI002E34CBCA|nr:helix-turn-helix transcriptional regulator [Nocardioides sp.]HEX5087816.1 helix-turn-helix transcriptional regulator [Nocardioides sp.]